LVGAKSRLDIAALRRPNREAVPLKIGAQSANPDMACQSHELVSAGEHVVERAESIRVVAIEAFALDPLEHVSEIDIAGTRLQVNFVAVTKTIGKAHLFDPTHVESVRRSR